MMPTQIAHRRLAAAGLAALLTAGALGAALPSATAAEMAQGSGNPILSVSPATNVAAGQPSTVQITGTDYLVPPHAPGTSVSGGVYVFFGWVDTSKKWGPSARNITNNDGNFGVTYLYPGAGGSADSANTGGPPSTGFVPFTATNAADGTTFDSPMDDNGNWTTSLTVPGPTFTTALPGGTTKTTDCRQLTCGIFTIGAHGKASVTNEKFTPIRFAGSSSSVPPDGAAGGSDPATSTGGGANPVGSTGGSSGIDETGTFNPTPGSPGASADSASEAPDALPLTGIPEPAPDASVSRPQTLLDDQAVAISVTGVRDSGTGGGLALFGVAALAALVMALTVSLFLRYRRDGLQA